VFDTILTSAAVLVDPDPNQSDQLDPDAHPDPHQSDKLDPDAHPDPHQSEKLDPDPHQFTDDMPKFIKYAPI
jgi:hypothetical protein